MIEDLVLSGTQIIISPDFKYKNVSCTDCDITFEADVDETLDYTERVEAAEWRPSRTIEELFFKNSRINLHEGDTFFSSFLALRTLYIEGVDFPNSIIEYDIAKSTSLENLHLVKCMIPSQYHNTTTMTSLKELSFRGSTFPDEYLVLTVPESLTSLDLSETNLMGLSLDGGTDKLKVVDFMGCKNLQPDAITFSENIPYSKVKWPSHIHDTPTKNYIVVKDLMLDMFGIDEFLDMVPWEYKTFEHTKHMAIYNPICKNNLGIDLCESTSQFLVKANELETMLQYHYYPALDMTIEDDFLKLQDAMLPSTEWANAQIAYIKSLDIESKYIIELYSYTGDRIMNNYIRHAKQGLIDMFSVRSISNATIRHIYKMLFMELHADHVTFDALKLIQPYIVDKLQHIINNAPPVDREMVVYRATRALYGIYTDDAFISTSMFPSVIQRFIKQDDDDVVNGIYVITVPVGAKCLVVSGGQYASEFEILLPHNSKFVPTATYGFKDGDTRSILSKGTMIV
uniref:ADP ribosyltransferase domain-containing protein n=1 Tax=viral metagenome TaxID=1070528 RepID=A0A6C0LXU2_9ZZZZ